VGFVSSVRYIYIYIYIYMVYQLNDQRMELAVKNVLAKLYSERLGKVGLKF